MTQVCLSTLTLGNIIVQLSQLLKQYVYTDEENQNNWKKKRRSLPSAIDFLRRPGSQLANAVTALPFRSACSHFISCVYLH